MRCGQILAGLPVLGQKSQQIKELNECLQKIIDDNARDGTGHSFLGVGAGSGRTAGYGSGGGRTGDYVRSLMGHR